MEELHDPFTQWRAKGVTPYWLSEPRPDVEARQQRLMKFMETAQREYRQGEEIRALPSTEPGAPGLAEPAAAEDGSQEHKNLESDAQFYAALEAALVSRQQSEDDAGSLEDPAAPGPTEGDGVPG